MVMVKGNSKEVGCMKITKYRTELNSDKNNILVKESSINYPEMEFNTPILVATMLNTVFHMNTLAEEYMYLIALNTKNRILGIFEVSHGTVNSALIGPREVFIRLFLAGASQFIIAHNHPSGVCTPSREDISLTERIMKCASMMGIPLLDHIIVGDNTYYSFEESNLLI